MNPKKTYEYLVKARKQVFDAVRPLSAADWKREFEIGIGRIDRTLTHIMICEYAYVERMQHRELRPYAEWPIQDEEPPEFSVLERAWREQTETTRRAIEAVRDWDAEFEYKPHVSEGQQPIIVTVSANDLFAQIVQHEVHHRAQVMAMLRQLGKRLVDLDYNSLMNKRRPAG